MITTNSRVGDVVWNISPYGYTEPCIILEFIHHTGISYCRVQSLNHHGVFGQRFENLFYSKEDAEEEIERRRRMTKDQMANEIKTPRDLFLFMIDHMHDDIVSHDVVLVTKIKIKEFFGIEV